MSTNARIYVLDTNVLMHDPTALFRFEEHDIYLPMVVLEELDASKKGLSEVARNTRQVSRFISDLMIHSNHEIVNGLALEHLQGVKAQGRSGHLFFETGRQRNDSNHFEQGAIADNQILRAVIHLQDEQRWNDVILVSKDINLRIKAAIHGIRAEDYHNDRALNDLSLLYNGVSAQDEAFWTLHREIEAWNTATGESWYRCQRLDGDTWFPNQCIAVGEGNGLEALVKEVTADRFSFRVAADFRATNHAVWGITARNQEQNFALNLLMDPDIDFVTMLGTAGTGKTLLALAAGLAQTLDRPLYREIIMTRATVSVGDEIGYLPGTEEEKMTPWMGALTDNLEVLANPDDSSEWARQVTNDLVTNRVKIRSLNFMRGRTFLNRYVIIDEGQNLTPKQIKTLLTRAGPGTKMVCLGNVEQIDTPYLTETTSGLTFAVDRFKHWHHSGHITLRRGERSRLADYASEAL